MARRKERVFEKAWPEAIKTVREKEEEAKKERLGMWEYGGRFPHFFFFTSLPGFSFKHLYRVWKR